MCVFRASGLSLDHHQPRSGSTNWRSRCSPRTLTPKSWRPPKRRTRLCRWCRIAATPTLGPALRFKTVHFAGRESRWGPDLDGDGQIVIRRDCRVAAANNSIGGVAVVEVQPAIRTIVSALACLRGHRSWRKMFLRPLNRFRTIQVHDHDTRNPARWTCRP